MTKILFRHSLAELGEYEIACRHSDVIESRAQVKPGDVVLGRYSVLPYYHELERDVHHLGGTMLTTRQQHEYVADMQNWYRDLRDLTPETWFGLAEFTASQHPGPFVLKGATNSRKNLWRTHMFAQDRDAAREVYFRLMEDPMIADQGVVFRTYEPFVQYGTSLSGAPVTKEFRFFVFRGAVVASGYYWASQLDLFDGSKIPSPDDVPDDFVQSVIRAVGNSIPFWVFDCAERTDGVWRVVELNDGQMSGLSCCGAEELYSSLAYAVANR
ncbi:MAG: ATP-grasp domain-containing protein [Patescibacteria group bacterium]